MKDIRHLLILFLPLFSMVSCSKDVKEIEGKTKYGNEILFEIDFLPASRVTTDVSFKSTWQMGDEIGIFAGPAGTELNSSGNFIHNVKLTYNGNVWEGEIMFWPNDDTKLDFYAYYPYDNNNNNPELLDPKNIVFNVFMNQDEKVNGKTNFDRSELLVSKSNNNAIGYAKGEVVQLQFVHAMAMVQVIVPYEGKGFGPSEQLQVSLKNFKTKSILDLSKIDVEGVGEGLKLTDPENDDVNIKMYRVEQEEDTNYKTSYTFRALVPIQDLSLGKNIFSLEQEEKLFSSVGIANPQQLKAGTVECYTVELPLFLHTVSISAGTFLMGSSDGSNLGDINGSGLNTTPAVEGRIASRETQHKVTLTKGFKMTKYLITNVLYAKFLNDVGVGEDGMFLTANNGNQQLINIKMITQIQWNQTESKWKTIESLNDYPVAYVTWYGADEFARWIGGSLPTEAQWEYACRAGTTTAYYCGVTYDFDYMWTWNNCSSAQVVGLKKPNDWGLYDMHGNLSEWCLNKYYTYTNSPVTDPNPTSGTNRSQRSGNFDNNINGYHRSAYRFSNNPTMSSSGWGFRVIFPE